MIFRLDILVCMMLALALKASATPSFHVKCIKDIYEKIEIQLPDSLGPNVDNDSTWTFSGKTLRVCTNRHGDISQIGYKLFPTAFVQTFQPREVLDFVERYALEVDICRKFGYKLVDRVQLHVSFKQGEAQMLSSVTPEQALTVNEVMDHGFVVECGSGDKKVVIEIPLDYQLLIGADAVELENRFERDLDREPKVLVNDTLPTAWKSAHISKSDSALVASQGYFLQEQIRSDLYLKKGKDGVFRLDMDKLKSIRYVNNLLLTGVGDQLIPLTFTFNKYGYKKVKRQTTLQQFLSLCRAEGCQMYIGFKKVADETVSATLFALNRRLAYNHMLSLEYPKSLLESGQGQLKGVLYAYTPLQVFSKEVFTKNKKTKK